MIKFKGEFWPPRDQDIRMIVSLINEQLKYRMLPETGSAPVQGQTTQGALMIAPQSQQMK